MSSVCIEALASIQSILRPRGPTINFALEEKQLRSIQQEVPLLNGSVKLVEPSSAASAMVASQPILAVKSVGQATIPTDAALINHMATPASKIHENSLDLMIEIRQPESSPLPSNRLSISNGSHDDDFSTPPMGVTTISSESPVKSTRMMTRKEALKVIAAVALPVQSVKEKSPIPSEIKQVKNETSPARKRPYEDSKPSTFSPPEKVLISRYNYSTIAHLNGFSLYRCRPKSWRTERTSWTTMWMPC